MTDYSSARRSGQKPPTHLKVPAGAWLSAIIIAGLILTPAILRLLSGADSPAANLMFPFTLALFSGVGVLAIGIFWAWHKGRYGTRPSLILVWGGGFILFCLLLIGVAVLFPTQDMARRQRESVERDRPPTTGNPPASATGWFLVVTADNAEVYFGPSMSSEVVATAKPGDIFRIEEREGDWYTIVMFSGEYRYLFAPLVKETRSASPLPGSAESRKAACMDLVRAEDRATNEAYAKFPSDLMKEIDYQRVLHDRYALQAFRAHNIAPVHKSELFLECAKNNWLPELGG